MTDNAELHDAVRRVETVLQLIQEDLSILERYLQNQDTKLEQMTTTLNKIKQATDA